MFHWPCTTNTGHRASFSSSAFGAGGSEFSPRNVSEAPICHGISKVRITDILGGHSFLTVVIRLGALQGLTNKDLQSALRVSDGRCYCCVCPPPKIGEVIFYLSLHEANLLPEFDPFANSQCSFRLEGGEEREGVIEALRADLHYKFTLVHYSGTAASGLRHQKKL